MESGEQIMRERFTFEREMEQLALTQSSSPSSVRPSPDAVEADAAEPVFTGPVRRPGALLPDAAALKKAIQWNKKMHPKISGISLAELQVRLEKYIDRSTLDDLVRQANAGASGPPYGSDEATIVTLLADQFQRKTCRRPAVGDTWKQCTMDGTVAEDTLDALGFIYHLGKKTDLNLADQVNTTADKTLKKVKAIDFQGVEPGLTAKTWWTYMVRPPWLGMPIRHGIHLVLLKRLRVAQQFLMSLLAYENLSPAELGKVLGLEEEHKGARPWTATRSMHTFGLGIDIGYTHNPWLSNPERNTKKIAEITLRAAQFIGGKPKNQKGITAKLLHQLAVDNQDTTRIYKILSEWSDWLGSYFALATDQKSIESALPILNAINPDIGFIKPGESLSNAAKRWAGIIKSDFNDFAAAVARGGQDKEAVRNGFMDLPRDLVLALREYACLAWGAVDFGPGESGDVMHFDCRVDGIGRAVRIATGSAAPVEGHRCIPAKERRTAQREFEYEGQQRTPKPSPKELRAKFISCTIPAYKDKNGNCRSTEASIYVPIPLRNRPKIDLLVFFHGDDTCSPAHSFDPDKVIKNFELDKQVDQGRRMVALAVPVLHWIRGTGKNIQGIWSAANLNAFVEEVLGKIGSKSRVRPGLGRLILAGHSHAYDIMTPLASEFDKGVSDTTSGALGKLEQVWALDTTYGLGHAKALNKWADKLATAQFMLVLSKKGFDVKKNDCNFKKGDPPIKYWECAMKGVDQTKIKIIVNEVSEGHCELPRIYIGTFL